MQGGAAQMRLQGQPFGAGQYAPYGARPKAQGGLNLGGLVTLIGFVIVFIGLFIPIRGIAGKYVERFVREYEGVSYNASLFTANIFIGIVTLLIVLAALAVTGMDTFVKPLGIIAVAVQGVAVIWTFIALFIARSAALSKVVYRMLMDELGSPSYSAAEDEVARQLSRALTSDTVYERFSTKFGFWMVLIGIIIAIAGIVLRLLKNMNGKPARPACS